MITNRRLFQILENKMKKCQEAIKKLSKDIQEQDLEYLNES